MAIPERIRPEWGNADLCQFAIRWGIADELASRLQAMEAAFPTGLQMISGARTEGSQNSLRAAGRPTAANDMSTHLACPATGADLRVTGVSDTSREVRIAFGAAAGSAGLRWGGGSPMDHTGIIPTDWNHVDLGPRG